MNRFSLSLAATVVAALPVSLIAATSAQAAPAPRVTSVKFKTKQLTSLGQPMVIPSQKWGTSPVRCATVQVTALVTANTGIGSLSDASARASGRFAFNPNGSRSVVDTTTITMCVKRVGQSDRSVFALRGTSVSGKKLTANPAVTLKLKATV